ncbi:hypothetical protein [Ruegeria lacuscaerulensis]|uniref:hypothetical protein n=1 Tax=Ruegeria lacuscaerulensis TaxID=55218 RepID=UPI0014812598|nr:hypothetical protein [Ruegeria lacuscaerulensis]
MKTERRNITQRLASQKKQSPKKSRKPVQLDDGHTLHNVFEDQAEAFGERLKMFLKVNPDVRYVDAVISVAPNQEARRLFHSQDGKSWKMVDLRNYGTERFSSRLVARGALELDGMDDFPTEIGMLGLKFRQAAGHTLVELDDEIRRTGRSYMSIEDLLGRRESEPKGTFDKWVEQRARAVRDIVAEEYVEGPESEEARLGREKSLVTIERTIDAVRANYSPTRFESDVTHKSTKEQVRAALQEHFIKQKYPFLIDVKVVQYSISGLPKARARKQARKLWADVVGRPHDARFDSIYGDILRFSKGHKLFGDRDYQKLEEMLSEALSAGISLVSLRGLLFVRSENNWRPVRVHPDVKSEAVWEQGRVVSNNYGRLIIPPHIRDGELVDGYTRNGPGEGCSALRDEPLIMKCKELQVEDTNLAWVHSFHEWVFENNLPPENISATDA